LLITFLSSEIAISINTHVPFFIITDYDFRFIVMDGPALVDSVIWLPYSHDLLLLILVHVQTSDYYCY
jgi:hypothetical protein